METDILVYCDNSFRRDIGFRFVGILFTYLYGWWAVSADQYFGCRSRYIYHLTDESVLLI